MTKKIFITGITSEIMQRLVQLIDMKKYEIYGLTRNPGEVNFPSEVNLVIGDIREVKSFESCLADCSILIHAAAVTHSFSEKKYFEVNLEATKNLISVANLFKVKKFVLISSNTAGEKSGAYGLTKYRSEKYLEQHFEDWLILRPSEIYGGNKKQGLDKLVFSLFDKAAMLYPTGVPTKFSPVFIEDVAQIIHQLIFEQKKKKEKITICGPEAYSFREIIHLVQSLKEKRIWSLPIPRMLMLLAERIAKALPFYAGITPDQIPRLYGKKNVGTTEYCRGTTKFKNYLRENLKRRS